MKIKLSSLALGLLVAAAGCKKGKEADAPAEPTVDASKAAKNDDAAKKDAEPDKKKEPAPTATVRAPTKDDLAAYTKDLPGDGKLMAAIHTTAGVFNCELLPDIAPMTVANFVGLARGKHPWTNPKTGKVETGPLYNGTIFHRVIPRFMIQGGDPLGRGSGGPGYRFDNETSPEAKHDKGGVLSMANAGPGTNGSQFFITEQATPHLDGMHTVFGYCKEVDLVKKITAMPRSPRDKPNEDVVIEKIEISKGGAAPAEKPAGDAAKGKTPPT